MIKVCQHCSGVDIDGLKKAFPDEFNMVGCVGVCKDIPDVVYGKVNNKLVRASSNKAFFEEVKLIIASE